MPHTRPDADARKLLGSLEYAVLGALWQDAPASVGEVRRRVNLGRAGADELAYTTVMTVLGRLFDKELLTRAKVGRGYAYAPRFTEDELVAHLGQQEVAGLVDRFGDIALAQFAAALGEADPDTLRALLDLAEERSDD